jgi:hypothetical protein
VSTKSLRLFLYLKPNNLSHYHYSLIREAIMDRDYTHPEHHLKGLIRSDAEVQVAYDTGKKRNTIHTGENPPIVLCSACGWTTSHQVHSGYDPRVKIMLARDNIGLWQIGSGWLLRDQPNDFTLGNDYATQEYLRNIQNLDVPLVKRMMRLSDPQDQIQLTLMSRVPGQPLQDIWDDLSQEQKAK